MAQVDCSSWRAAYSGLLPESFLAALSPETKGREWQAAIERDSLEGRKRWFVAEDAYVTGYALAGRPSAAADGMLYLLYTLPEVWGSGTGTALLDACVEFMRRQGLPGTNLWVLEGNARGRRFYEREGWAPTGNRTSDHYGGIELPALEYWRAL